MTRGSGYPDMRQQYEVVGESKKIATRKFVTLLVTVFLVIGWVMTSKQAEEDKFACLSFVGTGPSRVG